MQRTPSHGSHDICLPPQDIPGFSSGSPEHADSPTDVTARAGPAIRAAWLSARATVFR